MRTSIPILLSEKAASCSNREYWLSTDYVTSPMLDTELCAGAPLGPENQALPHISMYIKTWVYSLGKTYSDEFCVIDLVTEVPNSH